MLISSSFRDYYDSIKAFGIDKSVVYKREAQTLEKKQYERNEVLGPVEQLPYTQHYFGTTITSAFVVGFCGKIYPAVEVSHCKTDKRVSEWVYDAESLLAIIAAKRIELRKRSWLSKRWAGNLDSIEGIKAYFSHDFKPLQKAFDHYKTPVFMFNSDPRLVINPQLKSVGFMKVEPPAQAFQKIQQYISGVLGVEAKPMVKLSDKSLAKKSGHDGKYSFKTVPTKKRVK